MITMVRDDTEQRITHIVVRHITHIDISIGVLYNKMAMMTRTETLDFFGKTLGRQPFLLNI